MTRLTALTLKGNEVLFETFKAENGKWGCCITHTEAKYCRPIVTVNPVFDSKKVALETAEKVVADARKISTEELLGEIFK